MNTPILILAAIATCAVLYPLHRWLARRSRTTLDAIDYFVSPLLVYGGGESLKEKKSPHILRHSFATHVLNGGAEISKVKKIMGHASLASTQVYTNANIEQLKKVFRAAHPRGNKKD